MNGPSRLTIDEVYAAYWRELYIVAYRRLKSEEDVEDILQDIFLSLVQKPFVLEHEGSVRAYLHQALKYKIIDFFRKESLKAAYQQEELVVSKFSFEHSDEALLTEELKQLVQEEVDRMPEKMQQVYLLSRKDSLSVEQIAKALGISNQTVKNQISSALKRLRASLSEYAPSITFILSCLTLT